MNARILLNIVGSLQQVVPRLDQKLLLKLKFAHTCDIHREHFLFYAIFLSGMQK